MLSYLAQPDSGTCLVLRCRTGKPDRRNKLVAGIAGMGAMVEAAALAPRDRIPYLTEALQKAGKRCPPALLAQISRQPGGLAFCLRELDKVVAYAGGHDTITADMLEKVLTPSLASDIFRLVDAMGRRRQADALRELRALLDNGEPPFAVFAMMLRQYRLIFRAKACLADGLKKGQIAQAIGVQPFVAEKATEQSKYYSMHELEEAIALFCEKDLAMKSSVPYRQVLEDVVIALGT
jgi:DNA polymerase-3 subunit delta